MKNFLFYKFSRTNSWLL